MFATSARRFFTVAFYAILFVATFGIIVSTLYRYPLFPLQPENIEWSNAWLLTTVLDYYGTCLCLCGVVLASESSWMVGGAWVTSFCLLGSPACCLWVVLRTTSRRGGTLRLERLDHVEILDNPVVDHSR